MTLPANALKIFAYAGRHGYKDILGKTAPHVIGTPLDKVVSELPGYPIVPWVCFISFVNSF